MIPANLFVGKGVVKMVNTWAKTNASSSVGLKKSKYYTLFKLSFKWHIKLDNTNSTDCNDKGFNK